jgi:DnaJ-class molecular chaperone
MVSKAMKRMKLPRLKISETKCSACGGTGHEPGEQLQGGRRIYPPKCKVCEGKGRVKETAN